jgi:ribosome-associated protein
METIEQSSPLDASILQLVHEVANLAADRKAQEIRALDVRKLVAYTDYFVICAGRSDRQVRAVAEHIITELRELGRRPLGVEGLQHGLWVLIDYGDVVIHVFHEDERRDYDIERLWSAAPQVKLDIKVDDAPMSASPALA